MVVELHVLDDGDGQVFQGGLCIAEHKLLAVDENLLHFLAIDGDIAVFIDFCARHALDEFLNGRALRGAIGIRIEHKGILLNDDLCSTTRDDCLLEHDAFRRHQKCAKFLVLVATQGDVALNMLETYRRDLQAKSAVVRSLDGEVTFVVADGATNENAIGDSE